MDDLGLVETVDRLGESIVITVARRSVGTYRYDKRLKNGDVVVCEVHVFPLEVMRSDGRKRATRVQVATAQRGSRSCAGAQAWRNNTSPRSRDRALGWLDRIRPAPRQG